MYDDDVSVCVYVAYPHQQWLSFFDLMIYSSIFSLHFFPPTFPTLKLPLSFNSLHNFFPDFSPSNSHTSTGLENTMSSSQYRSSGSSSSSHASKLRDTPFRRCYCGLSAPFQVSWSDKNPGRRYFGCRYWPDEDKQCGFYEFYDEEISSWYKGLLNGFKEKKKPSADPSEYGEAPGKKKHVSKGDAAEGKKKEKGRSNADVICLDNGHKSLIFWVKGLVVLFVFFIVMVGILLGVLLKG